MTSPKLATTTEAGRYYWRDGKKYISVTTVLKALPGKGPALTGWAAKIVAQAGVRALRDVQLRPDSRYREMSDEEIVAELKSAPNRIRDAAGDRGSAVHAAAEALARGETLPELSAASDNYFDGIRQFFVDHKPVFVHPEATVFSDQARYAGTTDGIVQLPKFVRALNKHRLADNLAPLPEDSLLIMDYKTSSGVYKEAACQLAAYARCDVLEADDGPVPMPEVVAGVVVHVYPSGYDLYWADISDRMYAYFLAAMDIVGWEQESGALSKFSLRNEKIGR